MASGLRFVKRAVQADLARFKAYVEFEDIGGVEYKSVAESSEQYDGSQNGGGESDSAREDAGAGRGERQEQRRS
jgi:hypothetical protein